MSKICALASDTAALSLALIGIQVQEVADATEAEPLLKGLLEDNLDVLIIDERLRDGFSHRTQDRLQRHAGSPLIVYCPAFADEVSDVDAYLSSIIKPAVGFEIRLA